MAAEDASFCDDISNSHTDSLYNNCMRIVSGVWKNENAEERLWSINSTIRRDMTHDGRFLILSQSLPDAEKVDWYCGTLAVIQFATKKLRLWGNVESDEGTFASFHFAGVRFLENGSKEPYVRCSERDPIWWLPHVLYSERDGIDIDRVREHARAITQFLYPDDFIQESRADVFSTCLTRLSKYTCEMAAIGGVPGLHTASAERHQVGIQHLWEAP